MYNGLLGNRKGLICLFAPKLELYGREGFGGYDIFAQNYGGEIAQRAFCDYMPEVWDVLLNTGTPYIVTVKFPYNHVTHEKDCIAAEVVLNILYKYYFKSEYQPSFTAHLQQAITSKQIISIEQIKVLPS